MSRARWQEPNLARAPFVNERPVRRLGVLLWVLFVLVAGFSVWNSFSIRRATSSQIVELARLDRETASARERVATLTSELRSADLPAQNERTEFINRRLAERAFSWSRLLETLTGTMPRGVRLMRLSPESFTRERGRGTATVRTPATTRVALRITGEAEETEALLEFIDRLFQHPAFHRPSLSRESEKKDSKIQFELTVAYLPEVANELAGVTPSSGAIGAAAPAGAALGEPRGTPAGASRTGAAPGAAVATHPTGRPPTGALSAEAPSGVARSARTVGGRPSSPSGTRAAAREAALALEAQEEEEGSALRKEAAATPAAGSRFISGSAPGRPAAPVSGGSAPAAPPAATPGSGAGFPGNVLPTPLRPYASSTGGRR